MTQAADATSKVAEARSSRHHRPAEINVLIGLVVIALIVMGGILILADIVNPMKIFG